MYLFGINGLRDKDGISKLNRSQMSSHFNKSFKNQAGLLWSSQLNWGKASYLKDYTHTHTAASADQAFN